MLLKTGEYYHFVGLEAVSYVLGQQNKLTGLKLIENERKHIVIREV